MKIYKPILFRNALWLALMLTAFDCVLAEQPADPGWPRVFKKEKKQLTVYQPQVDYWKAYTNMHFRCAISVKGVAKQEKFGVGEVDAVTTVDQAARSVYLVPTRRELRFPNCSDSELAELRRAVDELKPPDQAVTLSLDRVNPSSGNAAWGGYRSGDQGTVGGIRTRQGSGMAAWNTEYSQGAVGRTRSGDIYASNGDTVYRRDSNGNWSQNSGSGWETTSKPQPAARAETTRAGSTRQALPGGTTTSSSSRDTSSWSQNRQSLESQAQARSWGNRQATQSFTSRSGSGWGGQSGGGRTFRGRR